MRQPKNITLSQEGLEKIQAFADGNNINFSRAIEALALMSLADSAALGQSQLVAELTVGRLNTSLDRFTQLIVHAGVEAGQAKEAAAHVYFLQLLQLAEARAERGYSAESIAQGIGAPVSVEGDAVLKLYKSLKEKWRKRSLQVLKKPLQAWREIVEATSDTR